MIQYFFYSLYFNLNAFKYTRQRLLFPHQPPGQPRSLCPLGISDTATLNYLSGNLREHYNILEAAFNAADEELLKKYQTIVEKNMENTDFSVDNLSRERSMSRSTLHLKLKSITGGYTIELPFAISFRLYNRKGTTGIQASINAV